jgi:hypothetical protein
VHIRGFRTGWLVAAAVWSVLVLLACLLPGSMLPEPEQLGFVRFLPNPDRWVHYLIFLIWAVLWRLVFRGKWDWVVIVIAGAFYGGLTEVLQQLGGMGRTGDLTDWVADLFGVGMGLIAAHWVVRWIEQWEERGRAAVAVPIAGGSEREE